MLGRGFEYGITNEYGFLVEDEPSEGYPTGAFGLQVSGLACGTTYHFRAIATLNDNDEPYEAHGSNLTFTTSACSDSSGGGNNGGGSSGGSSGGSRSRVVPADATILGLEARLAQLQAQLRALLGGSETPVGPAMPANGLCPRYTFARDPRFGDEGEDVRALQRFLNCAGFSLASTGPGAPGEETQYFVERTRNSVIRFHEAYPQEILAPIGATFGTGIFAHYSRMQAYRMMAE